jgi:virginiamycin B lyase
VVGRWQGWLASGLIALAVTAAAPVTAQATALHEFSLGGAAHDPLGLTSGSDGSLWFTDAGTTNDIGRITTAGVITHFTQTNGLNAGANPFDITLGPDGNVWFADLGTTRAIGRVLPNGTITEFPAPAGHPMMAPFELTVGPDGNLWFIDIAAPVAIGKVTPAGTITEFSAGLDFMAMPETLTAGADGNMWFTDKKLGEVGRVTPSGTIKEFPTGKSGSMPTESTLGADGNVWFSDPGGTPSVGRVKPDGTVTEFTAGLNPNADPDPMTLGPDGNVWFIDQNAAHRAVGRVTPAGAITEFDKNLSQTNPQDDITVGADGNIWVEQASMDPSKPGGLARITTGGVITEFTQGLNPGQGGDGDVLLTGPDGNLWFSDRGSKAIGKVSLQIPPTASTGAATAITNTTASVSGTVNPLGAATTVTFQYGTTPALGSSAGAGTLAASGDPSTVTASLTGLTPGTVVYYRVSATSAFGTATGSVLTFKTTGSPPHTLTTATIGNQQIQLVTPSLKTCTTRTKSLSTTLRSVTIRRSRAVKLRFRSASFFIDRGVRHVHKRTVHLRGRRKKTVTVVVFTPNAVVRRLPASPALRLTGLRSGAHTLKVTVLYAKTVTRRHHRRTVTVTKTVTARFNVC